MTTTENSWISGNEWLAAIALQLKDTSGEPETLTVRQFLAKFGCARRGSVVVARIRTLLEGNGLHTDPDFEYEHIDANVVVTSTVLGGAEYSVETPSTDSFPNVESQHDATIRMGSFRAARSGVRRVKPGDSLSKATTLMQIHRYSQVP